jgi:hypothetical protein
VVITCAGSQATISCDFAIDTSDLPLINGFCGLGGQIVAIGVDTNGDGTIDTQLDAAIVCPFGSLN